MLTVIVLLILSNILLNLAWYGHLLYPNIPVWQAILISWAIAFFEYLIAVPANRLGFFTYGISPAQLKIMQEAITLGVFAVFALVILQQAVTWNYFVSFGFLIAAVVFMFI